MVYKVSHNIIFIFEKQTNILKYIIAPEKKFLIIQKQKTIQSISPQNISKAYHRVREQ